MREFKVVVVEEIERSIVVKAKSETEAEEMVMDQYQNSGELGEGATKRYNTEVSVRCVDAALAVVFDGEKDTWATFETAGSYYMNRACAESDEEVKIAYQEICKAIIYRKNIVGDWYEVKINPAYIQKMMTPEGIELSVRNMGYYPTADAVILNRKWVYAGGKEKDPTHELNFVVDDDWLSYTYECLQQEGKLGLNPEDFNFAGSIGYIGPSGNVVETVEYADRDLFEEAIMNAEFVGAPIEVQASSRGKMTLSEFLEVYEPEVDGELLYQMAKKAGFVKSEYFVATTE